MTGEKLRRSMQYERAMAQKLANDMLFKARVDKVFRKELMGDAYHEATPTSGLGLQMIANCIALRVLHERWGWTLAQSIDGKIEIIVTDYRGH